MNRSNILLLSGALLAFSAHAQQNGATDQMVDRAIAHEVELMHMLQTTTPVAETYIQDLEKDPDFGTTPVRDHYFLGKVDLSHGLNQTSYLPKTSDGPGRFDIFNRFFTIRYLPKGFAQMMLLDGGDFDRNHYDFEFLRREFVGDVRTMVFAVNPKKNVAAGHFVGNIWIEDRGGNIVRFNGTYSGSTAGNMFLHFDSWRVNAGNDMWLPFETYSEESHLTDFMKLHSVHFKGITKFWGYGGPADRAAEERTNLIVQTSDDVSQVKDESADAADPSPVESLRAWEHLSEDNILNRLEKAGILARAGGLDKVLDTVVNNLEVTNDLNVTPEVRVRVMLTTPIESFTIGHTIILSRGLVDTLPDEASLAAILAHELAHIALGHATPTDFAFSDRLHFDDARIVSRFRLARSAGEEEAANQKAMEFLAASPYKDKLGQAGLYLKALSTESARLPYLNKPLFGDKLVENHNVRRLAALMEAAPQLQTTRVDQIAALPLGSRTKLDPWTDDIQMVAIRAVPLTAAREKLPFEITPVFLHLTYQAAPAEKQVASAQAGN